MLLELQKDIYLGGLLCECSDYTYRRIDSGVLNCVCFAYTDCHIDTFNKTAFHYVYMFKFCQSIKAQFK